MTAAISENSRAELRGISSHPNSDGRVSSMTMVEFIFMGIVPLLVFGGLGVALFFNIQSGEELTPLLANLAGILAVLVFGGMVFSSTIARRWRREQDARQLAAISEAAEARYGVSITSLDKLTVNPFSKRSSSSAPVSPEEWNQANRKRITELYGKDASKLLRQFNGVSYSFIEDNRIANGVGYFLVQGDELYLYDEAGVELPWR